jgi:hypothetical protein
MGKAISSLPVAAPQRASAVVLADNGGSQATVAQVLGQIELTDLPQGIASPGQALIWNGDAWAPATVLTAVVAALPTSASGLPSGAMWNNGGVLCVAP